MVIRSERRENGSFSATGFREGALNNNIQVARGFVCPLAS